MNLRKEININSFELKELEEIYKGSKKKDYFVHSGVLYMKFDEAYERLKKKSERLTGTGHTLNSDIWVRLSYVKKELK